MFFGQETGSARPSLKIKPILGIATTSLAHTWLWPRTSHVAALAAGVASDIVLLNIALAMIYFTGSWAAQLCSSVLIARILWQLRLHRPVDGYLVLAALRDDPTWRSDCTTALRSGGLRSLTSGSRLWLAAAVLGLAVDVALILGWLWPWVEGIVRQLDR